MLAAWTWEQWLAPVDRHISQQLALHTVRVMMELGCLQLGLLLLVIEWLELPWITMVLVQMNNVNVLLMDRALKGHTCLQLQQKTLAHCDCPARLCAPDWA